MSKNDCGGFRFYEVGYNWEDDDAPLTDRIRKLWAVGSTSGGKYVSVKTDDMQYKSTLTVTSTGESDNTTDMVKIKCERYISPKNPAQQLFHLIFSNGEKDYIVRASEKNVTASDKNDTSGTPFQFIELFSPNDSYVVFLSDKKNEDNNPLYLSSNGAGDMKLKVWNSPVPNPPRTTDEVDPALLFRLVRPFGCPK